MKTIIFKGDKMNKRKLLTIIGGVFTAIFAFLPFCSVSAWGPERTTYTAESPAPYATFNSITNNAGVGDERNFVRIGEVGSTDPYRDEIEIIPGKEYEVYIYYHNNAASNTNSTGYGIATNTRVSSAYPTILNVGERGMVSGIISWSYVTPSSPNNAQTGTVWDEAYVTTNTDGVVLRYKTGSAIIHNDGATNGSVLPTTLFTEEGTPIGFNKLTGNLPGCAEYSGYITYTLVAEKTDISLDKQVSTDGENWYQGVSVKPGEYVTYKVMFKNTGNTDLTNVIFQDSHDEGLSLRPGSVKVFDVNNVNGKEIDDILDISGYNVGNVAAGALVQIVYQAKVSDDTKVCGKTLNNTITVKYNSTESKTDNASVTIKCNQDCVTNPELPECKEIPNTGPLEIVMAIIVVLGIGGGGFYLYRTKRTLKKVEKEQKASPNHEDQTTKTEPEDKPQDKDSSQKR